MENLDELINAATEAAERGESIGDFLDHAALVADADSVDERAPVTLMTMHNAKGLEFPMVILAGMELGLFPHSRSMNSESLLEEERRLCYVGMTRARKKLILTWARYRRRFGGGEQERSTPSWFLSEVPPELIVDLGQRDEPGEINSPASATTFGKPPSGTPSRGKPTTRWRTFRSSSASGGCPSTPPINRLPRRSSRPHRWLRNCRGLRCPPSRFRRPLRRFEEGRARA